MVITRNSRQYWPNRTPNPTIDAEKKRSCRVGHRGKWDWLTFFAKSMPTRLIFVVGDGKRNPLLEHLREEQNTDVGHPSAQIQCISRLRASRFGPRPRADTDQRQ